MDIPTTFSEVLEKANDGRSMELGEAISKLLNEEWAKLSEALSADGMPPVVSLSFSPSHDKLIAILEQYIRFNDSDEIMGDIENMNLIASIYSTVNPETGEDDLSIDVDYYYGDTEFEPALYNGRELAKGERVKKFDHIPTTIDIIKMCIEMNTGTPIFDICKNAPFYDQIAPFLGAEETADDADEDHMGMDSPTPMEKSSMPAKIDPKSRTNHPLFAAGSEEDETEEDNETDSDDECRECKPEEKCPTCESRENCAMPCFGGDKDDPAEE